MGRPLSRGGLHGLFAARTWSHSVRGLIEITPANSSPVSHRVVTISGSRPRPTKPDKGLMLDIIVPVCKHRTRTRGSIKQFSPPRAASMNRRGSKSNLSVKRRFWLDSAVRRAYAFNQLLAGILTVGHVGGRTRCAIKRSGRMQSNEHIDPPLPGSDTADKLRFDAGRQCDGGPSF